MIDTLLLFIGAGIRTLDGWGWKIANPRCPDSGECNSDSYIWFDQNIWQQKSQINFFLANGKKNSVVNFLARGFSKLKK